MAGSAPLFTSNGGEGFLGFGQVCANASFSVPERSLTALVGPSGAGKTTVTRLLMRYANPQSGTIRIGGKDVRSMDVETLMGCVSVVFQDVYLFDDTIAANIRMGRQNATDEEVEAAARAAHCHEFIHRLSTIAAADRILVFEQGRLAEEGTHTELLAAGGRYQAMWQAQEQVKHWHV